MTQMTHSWPIDTFDAVSIKIGGCQVIAVGTNEREFKVESETTRKKRETLSISQNERWLQLSSFVRESDAILKLYLPREKTWLLEIVGHHGSVQAKDINAWLHLMLGRGQINIENSRGAITVISANADVSLHEFVETEVPNKPPMPEEMVSEKPGQPAKFPDWGKEDWAIWGLDIGQKFFRKIFDQTEDSGNKPGISMKVAKGSLNIQDLEAQKCIVRAAKSNVMIGGGLVSNLDINVAKGNIHCDSCIPGGEWSLRSNSGNINLSVTPDVTARLNASTRSGEIKSSVPLVKVTRQGPGAWHGGRMVGTVGVPADAKAKIPEIRLTALQGNINIEAGPVSVKRPEKPPTPKPPAPPKSSRKTKAKYKTPVEVLEALSKGQISVDDAEGILDNLGY